MRETLPQASPLASGGLVEVSGAPWLLNVLLSSPPSHLFPSECVCLCAQIAPFIRMPVILDQSPPQRLHLNLLASVKTPFPNKVTSTGTRNEELHHTFERRRDTVQPISPS